MCVCSVACVSSVTVKGFCSMELQRMNERDVPGLKCEESFLQRKRAGRHIRVTSGS